MGSLPVDAEHPAEGVVHLRHPFAVVQHEAFAGGQRQDLGALGSPFGLPIRPPGGLKRRSSPA